MLKKSRKHVTSPHPSSRRSDEAGGEGDISPSAHTKKANAGRKAWDDSDSGDSLPLGSGGKGPRNRKQSIEFAKEAIDRGSWKDFFGSSDVDNSSGSVCVGAGGVVASHFEKGTSAIPTARSKNNAADPKKRESHTMSVMAKAIPCFSLIRIGNAGKRERATSYNTTGSDLARTGKIRTQSLCGDNAYLFIRHISYCPIRHTINLCLAEMKASRIKISEDITSINQLQWYRMLLSNNENGTMEILQPCRVLSRGEAARCRRNNIIKGVRKMDGKNTVIQYLKFPDIEHGFFKCVEDSSLIPFGYASKDGLSATFNDDYLQRYLQQQSKKDTPNNLEAMRLFMKRVFVHAKETESKSREQAKKDLQEYYESSSCDEADNGHSDRRVSESKRVQFEVLENDDVGNDDDGENHDEKDDLDVPYTQAITFDPDDFGTVEGQSNEPIRPGDVIEYYCPIFVSGDARGLRLATVLAVDPNNIMPLVLSNGEGLHSSTKVKRIKVMSGDELVDHPGIFRSMHRFKLTKRGTATAADANSMEAARFGAIMKKNISRLKEKAEADGFAPIDLLVNIKGVKTHPKSPTKTRASTGMSFRRIERESLLSSSSDDSSNSETAKITSKQAMLKPLAKVASGEISCTGKINGNKENNRTAIGEEKKSRVGSLLSSASLGSSLATSDESSIESTSIYLGMNHKKMTQCKKSSPPKLRKLKANSQADANTYDLSLSFDEDDPKGWNMPQKRMGKSKFAKKGGASSSFGPCLSNNSVSSESSLDIPIPLGLTRKSAVNPSPTTCFTSPKQQPKRVSASVNRSTAPSSQSTSHTINDKDEKGSASKVLRRKEQILSSPPHSSTSLLSRSYSSIRKQAKAETITGTESRSRFGNRSSPSDVVEISSGNRSNPTTKKRPSPSSDSSSSDDGDDVAFSKPHRMRDTNEATRMQGASGQSRDCFESIDRPSKSKGRIESVGDDEMVNLESVKNLGWTRGKSGWEKSSTDGSGFRFSRYK